MLSYRHAFHAGNFADVLKHILLVEIVGYLVEKEKPFDYIDTHAGAGLYALDSSKAQKKREYKAGISRIFTADEPQLQRYLNLVREINPPDQLIHYPGSPKFAESLMREKDRGWLFELHPSDIGTLQQNFAANKRFIILQEDGFKGVIRLLPPQSRRACILIDPPYEIKEDYLNVVKTVTQAHKRFANGVYVIWYPVLNPNRADRMLNEIVKSGIRRIQRFELGCNPGVKEMGMNASGIVVINPPWKLFGKMKILLPLLAEKLSDKRLSQFRCDELVGE